MIRILDKQTSDKIAAGEVIDRPVSIVKELVENSIDAGAESITVEIKKGGKTYIRVTDDGCGIERDEVEKAFLRHATSKIATAKDLDNIETLGFRGEALASVCAVTRTEVLTKRRDDKTGVRVILHGAELLSNKPVGCPDGTTMIVTDLFYNTPARLKFLKSDSAESSLIIDLISRYALAYKDISFRLINNGNILFSTSGDGDRLETIGRIYPSIDIHNLVTVNYGDDKLKLEGYISTPAMSRTGRSGQIFFVNGRAVDSKVIERGLKEGYKQRLFEGRYPLAFLFLTTDASELDVNIHPSKREVRFDNEKQTEDFIAEAVKNALGTPQAVVRAADAFKNKPKENYKVNYNSLNDSSEYTGWKSSEFKEEQVEFNVRPPIADEIETPPVLSPEPEREKIDLYSPVIKPFDFDCLTVKTTIFDTYILAVDDTNFYLIDQHAAHERIFYERLVNQYQSEDKMRQPILFPILLNVDAYAREGDTSWLSLLREMGYDIEPFGSGSYRISEIPTFMELSEAENFARDFIDGFRNKGQAENSVVIDKLIMKSCKSAVKAKDCLSQEEILALLKDLKGCVNPFSCPHGRPTFVKLSKYEIERLFKRA